MELNVVLGVGEMKRVFISHWNDGARVAEAHPDERNSLQGRHSMHKFQGMCQQQSPTKDIGKIERNLSFLVDTELALVFYLSPNFPVTTHSLTLPCLLPTNR